MDSIAHATASRKIRCRVLVVGVIPAFLGLMATVSGCRTANREHAGTAKTALIAPPQVTSLDELATAVVRVLDDRQRQESLALPSPQEPNPKTVTASGDRPPQTRPPALDIDRMSVDELTVVVEQILKNRPTSLGADPGQPQTFSPHPLTTPTPDVVVASATTHRASPSPADPDEELARSLVRIIRLHRKADAGQIESPPLPKELGPAPEKLPVPPQIDPPEPVAPTPRTGPTSSILEIPPNLIAIALNSSTIVRMQSSEIEPDEEARPSEADLARRIVQAIRAGSHSPVASTEPPIELPETPNSPASSTLQPVHSAEVDDQARRIAIAIKAKHRTGTAPGGAPPGDGVVAAGIAGNPYAFSNPFEAPTEDTGTDCATCGKAHAVGEEGRSGCGPTCYSFPAHTVVGQYFGELYQSICCPDPCYKPTWLALANSAFFVDGVRPVTQMRIRYTGIFNLQAPDRNEFFFARADGNGTGPTPLAGAARILQRGKGVHFRSRPFLPRIDFNQLSLYTETANSRGTISAFVEIPYQSVQSSFYPFGSGFGNLNTGTRSILFDSPLLQLTFQFKAYVPISPVNNGLANGHVSLEPSLIAALRIDERTYLQGQLAQWIPLGGTTDYQGGILSSRASLNHQIWEINPDIPLIGTLEYTGYSFQTGGYSTFAYGTDTGSNSTHLYSIRHGSSGGTYSSLAAGLRMVVCNKVDFGAALAYPVSSPNWTNPQVIAEFRWRF